MPGYYNPYTTAMQPIQNGFQSYSVQPAAMRPIEWVTGRAGAQAFPMQPGFMPNQWYPLWDDSDTVIYLKSWNQMGAAYPLCTIRYSMEDMGGMLLPEGKSETAAPDMSQFVTKSDLEELKQELRKMNQNGSRNNGGNNGNRGENR